MSARDVIAGHFKWYTHDEFPSYGDADNIIRKLDAEGFVIVPKVPTEDMLRAYYQCMIGTHPKAEMNPDKYLVHNLKARKRWFAMLAAGQKEAVPGGAACQSAEQHRHETTSNDAQQD
ncbi:MAG: hypothetical protein EBR82_44115 [Caulobacteraceae bacterium]|nr:hypothetical protein [Caulobacteraceae bacterium]